MLIMLKDLTNSSVERQNVLNNKYAIEEIEKFIGIKGLFFEGQFKYTSKQLVDFFQISNSTLTRYLNKYDHELKRNGYEVITGERLSAFKKGSGAIIDEGTKTTKLGVFNFRSFLNLAMLLNESDRAKELRRAILDIVIDVMNKRLGGDSKYINVRDESFILNLFANETYHKKFIAALKDFVE